MPSSNGTYYDVTFSRAWKDRECGDAGYSQTFYGHNLEAVIRVAGDAEAWIENAIQTTLDGGVTTIRYRASDPGRYSPGSRCSSVQRGAGWGLKSRKPWRYRGE